MHAKGARGDLEGHYKRTNIVRILAVGLDKAFMFGGVIGISRLSEQVWFFRVWSKSANFFLGVKRGGLTVFWMNLYRENILIKVWECSV